MGSLRGEGGGGNIIVLGLTRVQRCEIPHRGNAYNL